MLGYQSLQIEDCLESSIKNKGVIIIMDELERLVLLFESELKRKDAESNKLKNGKKSLQSMHLYKIRDYFIIYIDEVIRNISYVDRIPLFFETVFNRQHIIDATVYYVEKNRPKGADKESMERAESSVKDFLIAFNQFYELVLSKEYQNPTLKSLTPFIKNLAAEIVKKVEKDGYTLISKKSFPAIQEKEYHFIIACINENKNPSDKDRQVAIIFQLLLLFGITVEKISNLKRSYYSIEKRTLKIPVENPNQLNTSFFEMELPYKLSLDISYLLSKSKNNQNVLLFVNSEGNPIQTGYFNYHLKNLRKDYMQKISANELILERFTAFGMARFAISKMLEASIMIPIIMQLTGRTMEFIESCRLESMRKQAASHYINYKIRSIDTYNDFR